MSERTIYKVTERRPKSVGCGTDDKRRAEDERKRGKGDEFMAAAQNGGNPKKKGRAVPGVLDGPERLLGGSVSW